MTNTSQNSVFVRLCVVVSVFSTTCFLPLHCEMKAQTVTEVVDSADYAAATSLSRAFRNAAKIVLPATVKVISHSRDVPSNTTSSSSLIPFGLGNRMPGDGMGTGFIIDPKGVLLTNYHVVAGARSIEVELYDGRKYKVDKVRQDERSDIAVLWVSSEESLPFLQFGDSESLDIGDWVLAIGNPFDLDSSVSAGIISAKGRTLGRVRRGDLLQTDAAINPGNSGGPLVNLKGELVGINTAIASQSGGYQGIGFAIPSENAKWVMTQLVDKGTVERAWLGVQTVEVTADIAQKLGVSPRVGVMIEAFPRQKTPADDAKLHREDVILAVDDVSVNSPAELQRQIERADIAVPHKLTIIREKKPITITVQLAKMPDSIDVARPAIGERVQPVRDGSLGLTMIPLTEDMALRQNLRGKEGLLILDVVSNSRGEKAGFVTGMLIETVDEKPVRNSAEYTAAKNAGSTSDGITFGTVLRGVSKKIIVKVSP